MTDVKCPYCGGDMGRDVNLTCDSFWYFCKCCGLKSPYKSSREAALAAVEAINDVIAHAKWAVQRNHGDEINSLADAIERLEELRD